MPCLPPDCILTWLTTSPLKPCDGLYKVTDAPDGHPTVVLHPTQSRHFLKGE